MARPPTIGYAEAVGGALAREADGRRAADAPLGRAAWAAIALALVVAHFSSFGLGRAVSTDVRYSVYFSSRAAAGEVPHRDFFDNRTPMSTMLGGGFVRVGERAGLDPLSAMRVGCLVIAAATGLLLFAVHRRLALGDGAAGLAGLLAYLGFPLLGVLPSIGPFPKVSMNFFALGAALLADRERWALAGAAAAFAALDWQIAGLVAIGVFAASILAPHRVPRAPLRVLAGGTAVAAATALWLGAADALPAAWNQVVGSAFARGAASFEAEGGGGGVAGRVLQVLAMGCKGHLWLAAVGAIGLVVFAASAPRLRREGLGRLAIPLAFHEYGMVAFSLLDFQRFGDLYALVQSLAFFAGVALATATLAAGRAAARATAADPGEARHRGTMGKATALAILALAVRPAWLHGEIDLRTRATPVAATLAGQRDVAAQVAARFSGKRLGVIGPSEMLLLSGVPNAIPFVYWNAAPWSYYRLGPGESERETLRRILLEARLDGFVYPEQRLGRDEVLGRVYERVEFVAADGSYALPVWVRRDS